MSEDQQHLRAGKLGVWGIVFFVIAAAAPLLGMTGALPAAIALGVGAAAPGAYLAAGLVLMVFSVGYAAMSHRMTNTGAFFAYVAKGLGLRWGVASSFTSLLAYLAIQLSIYGFFGGLVAGQYGLMPWWAWTVLAWALVTALSMRGVDVGAKLLGVLMSLEVLCLLVTAAAILIHGGPQGANFWASFSPAAILDGGIKGAAGIALAFAFASFIGFEATAIYGEESEDPKNDVPKATYLAVGLITLLFAFTAFGVVTGLGASKAAEETVKLSTVNNVPLTDPSAVLFHLATTYVGGWMATVMGYLMLSSLFAGLLAFQNSAARYFFALGRGGVLAASLAQVNSQGAPGRASLWVSAITLLVMALFALAGKDPVLHLFFWLSGIAVVAIVVVEILVCVAVTRYLRQNPQGETLWQSTLAPTLAALGLTVGLYLLTSRFGLLTSAVAEGVDPTTTAWGLSGLGWFLVSSPFLCLVAGYAWAMSLGEKGHQILSSDVMS